MNIHENARTTPASRALLVRRVLGEGWPPSEAAEAAGVSRRTAYKWLRRFREEGPESLRDRSSRAHRRPHALPAEWGELIVYLGCSGNRRDLSVSSWALRVRRSAPCFRAAAWARRAPSSHRVHLAATSAGAPAICCTWTSRSSVASGVRATASPAVESGKAKERAGTLCTWRSTITRASPMRRSYLTKVSAAASSSCAGRSPGTSVRRSPSSACSPTMEMATYRTASVTPARHCGCVTCARSRADPRPTGRRNGSYKPCFASGPTDASISIAPYAPATYPDGFASTMRKDPMPVSPTTHQSAAGRSVNNGGGNHT
jgi:hypothetical protein